ncbi:MAG: hypothetical protein ACYS9C_09035 [Planctomycetota bacterium]
MKPIINLSRNILILCLCLIALAGLNCRRRSDRASAHESKITLLCMGDSERSVFRDGYDYHFLMFIPLVDWDEEGQPKPRLLERWVLDMNIDFSRKSLLSIILPAVSALTGPLMH